MASLLGPLRGNHNFARLWSADAISVTGNTISLLAVPTVAILVLGAGPVAVGLLAALQRLPLLLFSMVSGVIADRARRPQRLLIICNLFCMAAIASVPIAFELHHLTLIQLGIVILVTAASDQLVEITYYSVMPSLIDQKNVGVAYSRIESTRQGAIVVGPGIAGVLIQTIGAARAVVADAVSFLAAAAIALFLRIPSRPAHHISSPTFRADLVEGLRLVVGDRRLRRCAMASAISNLGGGLSLSVVLLFIYRDLHMSPGTFGLIAMFSGSIAPFLALQSMRVVKRIGLGTTLALSGVAFGAASAVLPLGLILPAIPVVVLSQLLFGVEGGFWNVSMITLRQRFTPDELFGRMVATTRMLAQGVTPIALLAGGFLASWIGLAPTMVLGGMVTASCGVFLLDRELLLAGIEPREALPSSDSAPKEA